MHGQETKFTTGQKTTSSVNKMGITVELGGAKLGAARETTQVTQINGTSVNEPSRPKVYRAMVSENLNVRMVRWELELGDALTSVENSKLAYKLTKCLAI
jgi:hypothetical protein